MRLPLPLAPASGSELIRQVGALQAFAGAVEVRGAATAVFAPVLNCMFNCTPAVGLIAEAPPVVTLISWNMSKL